MTELDPSVERSIETAETSDVEPELGAPIAAAGAGEPASESVAPSPDPVALEMQIPSSEPVDSPVEGSAAVEMSAAVPDAMAASPPVETDVPIVPPAPVAKMDRSAFFRAIVVLTGVGASWGGFFAQIALRSQIDSLVTKNEMPGRLRMEVAMGATGLAFLLISLIYVLLGRRTKSVASHVESLHRFAVFLLPTVLATLVPPLFRLTPWATPTMEFLLILLLFGVVLEPLARASLSSVPLFVTRFVDWWKPRLSGRFSRWTPPAIVGVAALGYAVFASVFTLIHHFRFGTACWDLGQYDNLFYNALHGHPFRVTSLSGEADWKSLRGHAEVGMYFILPFYAIRASSEALLVIQAVLLGSAAIPIYLFATRFISRWSAMCLALVYVLYAPLHRSNFYDFHMQPIAAAFTLWMLYFFVAQRNVLFWISFLLALTAREDISIGLAVFGTFLMVTGYRARVGLVVTIISVIYFGILKGVIMPLAGGWWFANIYKNLQIPGKQGYGSIVETLVSNPIFVLTTLFTKEKLILALQILLPVAFLPLRRPYLILALVPGFFFTLLTTGYNPTVTTMFQYNAYWISYIFPATAVALRAIGGQSAKPDPDAAPPQAEGLQRQRAALVAVLFLSAVTSFHFGALLQRTNFKAGFSSKIEFAISADEWKRYHDMRTLAAMIPQDAKLAATEHVAPHVSARVSLYCFRDSIGEGEYVIFGMLDKNGRTNKALKDLLHKGKLGVIAEQGDFVLLKKGASTERNAAVEKRL